MSDLVPHRFPGHMRGRFPFFGEDFMKPLFSGFDSAYATFRVDVRDEGEEYVLEAELPGLKREDITVDVDDGLMTISAQWSNEGERSRRDYVINERRSGRVQRAFSLDNVVEESITAEYENGMLRVKMPKRDPGTRAPRRIELN